MKLNRISHMLALGGFVAAVGLGVPSRARAAPTAIDCPEYEVPEARFFCTYQASPYEEVMVITNVTGYVEGYAPTADADGMGVLVVFAQKQSGPFSVCVWSMTDTSIYVCDEGTIW